MNIDYVTSNSLKFMVGKRTLEGYQKKGLFREIMLRQTPLNLDEIQSLDISEITVNSARQAYSVLKKTLAVSDVGLYVEGLNGFPGPFLKYMNHWFQPEDVLCLLRDCENRNAEVRECLAIADEDGNVTTWEAVFRGKIVLKSSKYIGTTMERIFAPAGMERTIAEMTRVEQTEYWQTDCAWSKWLACL